MGGRNKDEGQPWFSGYGNTGFLGGSTPGRSDVLPMSVPENSYVIPADVVSSLGEGNSNSGASVLGDIVKSYGMDQGMDAIFGKKAAPELIEAVNITPKVMAPAAIGEAAAASGPVALGAAGASAAAPAALGAAGTAAGAAGSAAAAEGGIGALLSEILPFLLLKDGGKATSPKKGVDVIVANGEYIIPPEDVARLGRGDMMAGHETLDGFVKKVRQHTIKELKKLPPPRK